MRSRDPQNPLIPKYNLQKFEYVPPEPAKFVRDSMIIDDIEGTRSKVDSKIPKRDPISVKDILGA